MAAPFFSIPARKICDQRLSQRIEGEVTPTMIQAPIHCILYVEDDENDIFFLRRAFGEVGIEEQVRVVRDGQSAIDYLDGEGVYADRLNYPLPSLILLDLQLALRDGLEVLKWIRSERYFRGMVVIVFTSSHHPKDVDAAYELGVNSFVVKPMTISDRVEFAKELKAWWLHQNQFATVFNGFAALESGL